MDFTYSLEELESVADAILKHSTSKTLLFYGEMGVGKTTLIKALSKKLGSAATVNSPTFSIVNEYEIQDDLIYHFDLFRIEDEEEALNFGIEDYLFSNHYNFIEWPERIITLLPEASNKIEIKLNLDGSRTLKLSTDINLNQEKAKKQKKN
ncbi:tRNA threonylcarbamoyladenosine biosynthesis protein TsaE [Gelidibacter algens]|uniref:tRNA threonylcarbamoyladenosine biosynthesis protein TsaE n=1 Tax=Gelidibacter algens TaxID=49280 RepID=A0A1A7QXR9_9FLAO|nr:tRNA (adenosine(37)-N6)-threonylcarbamoyltransferase complex ATPase subunit type 1 TsaE [Gelidibacter algens]OBX24810.1 tRNA (N6-adenosine(37)-N6)-threonylcarbamoyltransferase complex ATPase TsaE [Gelidibacter algens]RAJ26793.1 tRNA threonylcarbamoyladenosine biosynthesis protein TsaE [Gelidibacter algens]